jgi:hypothetical protein
VVFSEKNPNLMTCLFKTVGIYEVITNLVIHRFIRAGNAFSSFLRNWKVTHDFILLRSILTNISDSFALLIKKQQFNIKCSSLIGRRAVVFDFTSISLSTLEMKNVK